MSKAIAALICTAIFTLTMSANTRMNNDYDTKDALGTMTTVYQRSSSNEEVDIQGIMNACNESFRIEMGYLESLNESGSFVDETDRTPKCYIRCLLENIGVISEDDGMFNPPRAAVMFAGERNGKPMTDIADMTALCATNRNESCRCDRAYQFMRCLMSMEIERYESTQ